MSMFRRLLFAWIVLVAAQPALHAQLYTWRPQPPRRYVNTWLVSGLFGKGQTAARTFDQDWIGEASATPTLSADTWRYFDDRLFSRSYDNYQDFFSYFAIKHRQDIARKCAYAATRIWSPQPDTLQLALAADSMGKAWINGAKILDFVDGSGRRTGRQAPLPLRQGWNLLLVKIATQEQGRFGFYAALTAADPQRLDRLIISPDPSAQALSIVTAAMPDIQSPALPTAWRQWPYVQTRAPYDNPAFGPASESRAINLFAGLQDQIVCADAFYLAAAGGAPPYTWNLGAGHLPPGLELTLDGRLRGTVHPDAPLGDYPFQVWLRDSHGTFVSRDMVLTVRERPNRWFESDRLTGLSHNKRRDISPQEIADNVKTAARQGYRSLVVTAYNNGDGYFRWPARLSTQPVAVDLVTRLKREIEANGMTFGMYLGTLQAPIDHFGQNQGILVIREMMDKFHPKIVWLDWSATDHVGVDALFSVIRTISPQTVIVVNGHVRGGTMGDWDSLCFEGWDAWGNAAWSMWPQRFPWAKAFAPESWRYLSTGAQGWPSGDADAWRDMLKVQLALIGQGFVADIDHSFDPCAGDVGSTSQQMLAQYRQMARWTSPPGKPPLYPSFTQVDPAPLPEAPWGYSLINTARDTLYLHLLKNPHGKTGLPADPTLTVNPIDAKVKRVTWMNENKPLDYRQPFTGTDHSLTIQLDGVSQDPIDTILRVDLASPLPDTRPAAAEPPTKNLALHKPVRNISTDGQRLLYPSGRVPAIARYGVDGDVNTAAQAAWEWAWSYEVDLQRAARIDRVVLTFPADRYPTEYRILTSFDGVSWMAAKTIRNSAGGRYEQPIDPVVARWIRIEAVKPDGPNQTGTQMAIAELEVYEAEAVASH